ncbi:MAG: alpha/beta hydrolase [Rhizobiales bacterium]|nr:alpha/beta hydrolase [Hyphomicrobiales bacterium]MBI3674168.1 alpha/beta hydrolase [Hyphomicrobiales bacterium]
MDLVVTPENPPPENARCVTVAGIGGLAIRAMYAIPREAHGTVLLIGGRGDYMERYFETMRDLMVRGFAVASFDFRGQGGSQRLLSNPFRGHIGDFSDYVADLEAVMSQMVVPNCPSPIYAIGHSTGGNVLLLALRQHIWFARTIVLAPLIGLNYANWPLPVVRFLLRLNAMFGLGWMYLPGQNRKPMGPEDFPGNPLTSDERRWRRDSAPLEVVPTLGVGGPTFSWLRAARRATAQLQAMGQRDRLSCPVMVVAAGLDRVVDGEAIRRFAARVPGVAFTMIRESLHEILTERDEVRNQFLAIFDSFVGGDEPA